MNVSSAFAELKKTIISTKDISNGADQKVFLVTCEDGEYIYKEPVRNPEVIENEVLGCKAARKAGVPAPRVIVSYPNKYLIETVIKGEELTHAKEKSLLYKELGITLRKLHEVPQKYFGEFPDASNTGVEFLELRIPKELEAIKVLFDEKKIDVFWNKRHTLVTPIQPVCLHRDLGAEHVFVSENKIAGLVDWGDFGGGYPEEDIAVIYMELQENENFTSLLQGYQKEINMERVLFYVGVKLARQIGGKLRAKEKPVEKKIELMKKILSTLATK